MTAVLLLCLFFVLKSPATKSAPAIVKFSDEQLLRAQTDGFVFKILVEDGQEVSKGQKLIVFENDELKVELEQLKRQAEEAGIEARINTQQGEHGLAQIAIEKQQGFVQQYNEKKSQLDSMTLTAPFDGFVFQRNLAHRIGSFAKRGDPLLTIGQASTKTVEVSIDQRDLESIRGNEGKSLRVAVPGLRVFNAVLTKVDPKATSQPKHPTLCANAGGPLAVRPVFSKETNDDSAFELLNPRFTVELELKSELGQKLQAGQRGRAFFATKRQSLGGYLMVAATDWLKSKIEIATQTAVF